MEFFYLPGVIFFYDIFMVIVINLFPRVVYKENEKSEIVILSIFASIIFILGYFPILWSSTHELFIIFVATFAFSYIHICFTLKRKLQFKLYTVIFIVISVFFVLWTTAMFGKYYVENDLVDFSYYISQYNSIIDTCAWFPITDFKLSIIFFDVSFEKYFILPDDVSLKNPFFIQFIYGIMISGTTISWVIDTIKYFVTPSKPN